MNTPHNNSTYNFNYTYIYLKNHELAQFPDLIRYIINKQNHCNSFAVGQKSVDLVNIQINAQNIFNGRHLILIVKYDFLLSDTQDIMKIRRNSHFFMLVFLAKIQEMDDETTFSRMLTGAVPLNEETVFEWPSASSQATSLPTL